MVRYLTERKESVVQKMMPLHSIPIPQLANESGNSVAIPYNWQKQAKVEGIAVPADGKNSRELSKNIRSTIFNFGRMTISRRSQNGACRLVDAYPDFQFVTKPHQLLTGC